jgi:hypothetical protein
VLTARPIPCGGSTLGAAESSGTGGSLAGGGRWPGQSREPESLTTSVPSRRSGDQFNVYICDRFAVPALTSAQQHDIGAGRLLLDQTTRSFIREHLSYRFMVHQDGVQAFAVERAVRAGSLPQGGLPEPALTARRPASRRRQTGAGLRQR